MSVTSSNVQLLASKWARLGVGFNVTAARTTPDIERLIIDTAIAAHADARLFQMVVTWISRNAELIAVRRLGAMERATLADSDASAILGLMLQLADRAGAGRSLKVAIDSCVPARVPSPLFDADNRSPAAVALVSKHAIRASRHWGKWIDEFESHPAALKPLQWIVTHNRKALTPRLTLSDADLSVWLELQSTRTAIHAAEIARRAGISRMQALRSIDRLKLLKQVSTPTTLRGRRLALASV